MVGLPTSWLLAQIRRHSCPAGDGIQRLAHYAVQNPNVYCTWMKVSVAERLSFYEAVFHGCPSSKISISFAITAIVKAAETAKILNVVDFGILDGFQWPPRVALRNFGSQGQRSHRVGSGPERGSRRPGNSWQRCCERLGGPIRVSLDCFSELGDREDRRAQAYTSSSSRACRMNQVKGEDWGPASTF